MRNVEAAKPSLDRPEVSVYELPIANVQDAPALNTRRSLRLDYVQSTVLSSGMFHWPQAHFVTHEPWEDSRAGVSKQRVQANPLRKSHGRAYVPYLRAPVQTRFD